MTKFIGEKYLKNDSFIHKDTRYEKVFCIKSRDVYLISYIFIQLKINIYAELG